MSVVAPSQWVMTYVPSIGCACLTFWLFQFLLWFLLAQWIHIGIIFSWRLEGEFYRSTQHAHATHPLVNHVLFLQGTLRCLILTFRQDKPRGRCFGTGKHSKKNKTLWTDFFFPRLNIKKPKSGCFSKHDEGNSNYTYSIYSTYSTRDGLMGVQLLSIMLDIRSETISLLKKLWLNWQEETGALLLLLLNTMRKNSVLRPEGTGTSNWYE